MHKCSAAPVSLCTGRTLAMRNAPMIANVLRQYICLHHTLIPHHGGHNCRGGHFNLMAQCAGVHYNRASWTALSRCSPVNCTWNRMLLYTLAAI